MEGSFLYSYVYNNAFIRIVIRVEDQGLQRGRFVALGGGNFMNDLLHDRLDVGAHFRGDRRGAFRLDADHILDFLAHPVRIGAGQVDFINDRNDLQSRIHRQIGVGQGLGLNALRGVHHQNSSLAGGQRAGDLIVEVHMAGGVDEIENIVLAVVGVVNQRYRMSLDGNAPLTLQIHVVQKLVGHIPQGNRLGLFQNPVRQGGFAVVDVGDNAEVSNLLPWN